MLILSKTILHDDKLDTVRVFHYFIETLYPLDQCQFVANHVLAVIPHDAHELRRLVFAHCLEYK